MIETHKDKWIITPNGFNIMLNGNKIYRCRVIHKCLHKQMLDQVVMAYLKRTLPMLNTYLLNEKLSARSVQ